MFGGGTDYSTLQPERFHGCGIAVLVFVQLAPPHHVIGRKPRSGFSLVLFLAFAFLSKAFGGDNGYDSSVQVRSLLVHVQYT